MTREMALGSRPSIVFSSICFGHLGAMALEGKRKGLAQFLVCAPSIQLVQKPGVPHPLQKGPIHRYMTKRADQGQSQLALTLRDRLSPCIFRGLISVHLTRRWAPLIWIFIVDGSLSSLGHIVK